MLNLYHSSNSNNEALLINQIYGFRLKTLLQKSFMKNKV